MRTKKGKRRGRGDISQLYHDPIVSLMLLSVKTKAKALAAIDARRAAIYEDIGNQLINGYLQGKTGLAIVRFQPFHCARLPMVFGYGRGYDISFTSYRENANLFVHKGLVHRFLSVDPEHPDEEVALHSLPELNAYYMEQGEAVYRNYLANLVKCDEKTAPDKKGAMQKLRTKPPPVYCEWVGK